MENTSKLTDQDRWLYVSEQLGKCKYGLMEQTMSQEEIENVVNGVLHYMLGLGGDFASTAMEMLAEASNWPFRDKE